MKTTQSGRLSGLRRVAAPPRALQGSSLTFPSMPEPDEDEGFFFDHYNSPCFEKASNDAFSIQDIDNFKPCNLTFYGGCLPDVSSLEAAGAGDEADVLAVDVAFDYELYARRGSNMTRTLAFLEGSVLEHMASAVGLNKCQDGPSASIAQARSGGGRLLNSAHFTDDQSKRFLGVSAASPDAIDPNVECFVPVTSAVANVGECVPVSGSLRAYISNDPPLRDSEKLSIQSSMLRLIRSGMKRDVYVSGNVLQSVFIGQRTASRRPPVSAVAPEPEQVDEPTFTNQNLVIIVSVTVVMAACLCLGALFMAKRRREERRQEAAVLESDTDDERSRRRRSRKAPSTRITALDDVEDDTSSRMNSPPWLQPSSPSRNYSAADSLPVPNLHTTSALDRICDNASNSSIDWNEGREDDVDDE